MFSVCVPGLCSGTTMGSGTWYCAVVDTVVSCDLHICVILCILCVSVWIGHAVCVHESLKCACVCVCVCVHVCVCVVCTCDVSMVCVCLLHGLCVWVLIRHPQESSVIIYV